MIGNDSVYISEIGIIFKIWSVGGSEGMCTIHDICTQKYPKYGCLHT